MYKTKSSGQVSPSEEWSNKVDERMLDVYEQLAVYMLIISIRDVTYEGNNSYMIYSRRKSILWFKKKDYIKPLGFGSICKFIDIDPDKFWLQIRRWCKVNKTHLAASLKGAECGLFDQQKKFKFKLWPNNFKGASFSTLGIQ